MGIVPLCTPIPFALSRSFHSVPPIIRGQAASNYFIGASAAFPINAQGSIPSVFGRPSTCTALSSAKYRLLLSPLDFPRLNGKFNRARRRFSRRSPGHRKQPSVILFYRVFNKDRDWAASKALLLLFVKYFLSVSYVTFHRGERYFLYIDYTRFIDVFLPFPNAT